MKKYLFIILVLTLCAHARGGHISLKSKEGMEITIEESVARLSGLIESVIDVAEDATEGNLQFSHIASNDLRTITEDLKSLHAWYKQHQKSPLPLYEHDENIASRTQIAKQYEADLPHWSVLKAPPTYSEIVQALELLKISDYLNIPELMHRYAWGITEHCFRDPVKAFEILHDNAYQGLESTVAYYLSLRMSSILFAVASPDFLMVYKGKVYLAKRSPAGTRINVTEDPTMVVVASEGRAVSINDVQTGAARYLIPQTILVYASERSPDGTKVLTSSGSVAAISDIRTRDYLYQINYTDCISGAKFSPDGTKVITSSGSNYAHVIHFPLAEITDLEQLLAVCIARKMGLHNIDKHLRAKIESIIATLTPQQQEVLCVLQQESNVRLAPAEFILGIHETIE